MCVNFVLFLIGEKNILSPVIMESFLEEYLKSVSVQLIVFTALTKHATDVPPVKKKMPS